MIVELVGDYAKSVKAKAPPGASAFFYMERATPSWERDRDLFVVPVMLLVELPGDFIPPAQLFAYGDPEQLSTAFMAGCSDYLRIPWDMDELETRAFARLDRDLESPTGKLHLTSGSISGPADSCALKQEEMMILRMLLNNSGSSVARKALLSAMDGVELQGTRALDMKITRLRRKLVEASGSAAWNPIIAERGKGYRLNTVLVDKL